MSIKEVLAAATGSILFVIGAGMVIIYCIISFTEGSVVYIPIVIGLVLVILGWRLTKYAAKTTGMSIVRIIVEAIT